jgi:hypothetical protein
MEISKFFDTCFCIKIEAMKPLQIFFILAFLFAFASNISAQRISYPNELKGFELFKSGKWKTLVPFVSTKEDVEKILGQDCRKGCDYSENWRIEIQFVEQSLRALGKEQIPCVFDKYLGKYESISFYPKKRTGKKHLRFGKVFTYGWGETYDSEEPDVGHYSDKYGLTYRVYHDVKASRSLRKGDLIAISYGISDSNFPKYHNMTGLKKGEPLICHRF